MSTLLAPTLLAVCAQGAAQEPVPAVWKEREFFFSYRSSLAIYACSSLEGRVANILRAIGARPDLEVRLTNCRETTRPPGVPEVERGSTRLPGAPVNQPGGWNARETQLGSALNQPADSQQSVNVLVSLSMPVEVTPEVAEELRRDKSRRELISKATGKPGPRFDDPIVFAAERRVVTLSRETIGLEPVECELLDQISASGFRELGVRVVSKGFVCDRKNVSLIAPELDVEALLPVGFETSEVRQEPAAGGDEAEPGEPAASDAEPAAPAASDAEPAEPATDEPPE